MEKDKNSLLQSYQRLGQSALDHSKDKFLVQSVAVLDSDRAGELKDYDKLTAMWASVGSSPSTETSAVANKKLHVRHIVSDGAASAAPATAASAANREPIDSLSNDQLKNELSTLRRKYDELVAFSVNLTAERDMLNNTMEQTKRDLNRELSKSAAADNARRSAPASGAAGYSMPMVVLIAVLMMVVGVKLQQFGMASKLPVLGGFLEEGGAGEDEL